MKNKTIPTILGTFFLVAILVVGVILSTKRTSLDSSASSSCEVINPQTTNLTHFSFDLSFTTSGDNCSPTLSVNNKIYEDLSKIGTTHYFRVSGLQPKADYEYKIISGGKSYASLLYRTTTASRPSGDTPSSNLAWGKVLDSNLKPVANALLYLSLPGAQPLSALTNSQGQWNIPLSNTFNDSKNAWFTPQGIQTETIVVYSPDNQVISIENKTDNNDPVPDIIFGSDIYQADASPQTKIPPSNNLNQPLVTFTVTNPKEGETIYTPKPDIFGTGQAGSIFNIKINTQESNVTVLADNTWHWSPLENLNNGPHTIVLDYQGTNITRNFVVAAGNQSNLSFTATPSATLIPTKTSSPSPTIYITPTQIPPTSTPIPTIRTAKISTTSSLIKSGTFFPTFLLITIASLLFGVSFYYYRED